MIIPPKWSFPVFNLGSQLNRPLFEKVHQGFAFCVK